MMRVTKKLGVTCSIRLDTPLPAWHDCHMNFFDNTDTAITARALRDASTRRIATRDDFIPNPRPADRSRNGQRTPRSVPRRNYR